MSGVNRVLEWSSGLLSHCLAIRWEPVSVEISKQTLVKTMLNSSGFHSEGSLLRSQGGSRPETSGSVGEPGEKRWVVEEIGAGIPGNSVGMMENFVARSGGVTGKDHFHGLLDFSRLLYHPWLARRV